ncbi:MAG: DUF2164 domain-containing protein [Pseudomonadota bacterium]
MMRQLSLTDDRRDALVAALQDFFRSEFNEDLSAFRAEELLAFMVEQLGPTLYNHGIQDARAFLTEKLDDLDSDFPMPEER